ncbi:hypothetical protein LCGC14_1874250 [marine sediment metagenome]|uniref:Uncharacterized protein n=1 Tax=marine sediment metagenome TaxID=412755 RepID=A0A0F9G421_9ZZZZ
MTITKRYVDSWDEVTDEEMEAFHAAVYALETKMLPVDCDGDPPVNIIFVDRRKYWPLHYYPVIYNHDHKEDDKQEEALLDNLGMAVEALQKFRYHHRRR